MDSKSNDELTLVFAPTHAQFEYHFYEEWRRTKHEPNWIYVDSPEKLMGRHGTKFIEVGSENSKILIEYTDRLDFKNRVVK